MERHQAPAWSANRAPLTRRYLGYDDLVFRPTLYRAFRIAERPLGPFVWRSRALLNR